MLSCTSAFDERSPSHTSSTGSLSATIEELAAFNRDDRTGLDSDERDVRGHFPAMPPGILLRSPISTSQVVSRFLEPPPGISPSRLR